MSTNIELLHCRPSQCFKDTQCIHPLTLHFALAHQQQYAIVNIPPIVMFKAKIFKPSRMCAVFRVSGRSAAQKAEMERQRQQAQNSMVRTAAAAAELAAHEEQEAAVAAAAAASGVSIGDAWEDLGSTIRENFEKGEQDYDDDAELDALVV
jgi:hypothetical protein